MARFLTVTLIAFAASAVALTTPHNARYSALGHAELAARLSSPAEPATPLVKQRIRRAKRCPQKPLSSSSAVASATTPAATTPAATSTAAQTSVPVNAALKPSSSSAAPEPTSTKATTAAPKPTKTTAAPPKTTATPKTTAKPTATAKPTSSAEPTSSAPAPASNAGTCGTRSLTGTMTGDGTFFDTGLGACGKTTSDSDLIVAVSQDLYDTFPGAGANPNLNPICGKKIQAHYQGKSVTVTVVDRCVGCACGSLDFSPAAFDKLADESVGRLQGVTWNYV